MLRNKRCEQFRRFCLARALRIFRYGNFSALFQRDISVPFLPEIVKLVLSQTEFKYNLIITFSWAIINPFITNMILLSLQSMILLLLLQHSLEHQLANLRAPMERTTSLLNMPQTYALSWTVQMEMCS